MPQTSACIGLSELALASIANWPASCARAIQAFSSGGVRTVRYLLRSTGSLRASSARACASARGVPLKLAALSLLSPLLGVLPLPLAGEGGVGVPPPANSKRPPPGSLRDPTSPASGRGEEALLLLAPSASTSEGSICEYSA